MAEHPETLETALAAYLITQPFPDSLKADDGTYRIFAGESEGIKDGQTLLVYVAGDLEEEPLYTGNFWGNCIVEIRTPIRSQVDGDSITSSLEDHRAAAAVLNLAMMSASIEQDISSIASGIYIYKVSGRSPMREHTEFFHGSGFKFRIYSRPA